MVQISTLFVAGLLASVANALPRPDSSINEPAVSAPNGTPITDTSAPQATSTSGMSSSDMSSASSMNSDSSMSSGGSMSSGSSMGSGSSMSSGSGSSGYGSSDNSWSSGSGSGYGSGGSSSDNSWTTSVAVTSTSTAWSSYSTPSYGSGSSNWDSSGYNDCVSQCMANYGGLPATYTPSSTSGSSDSSSGSSGSGATHTVIVAPTQGVLRYVPFALNASVGDTIQFMWGANNHTVTKSSELTPCNKTSDSPFTSGEQNQGFMFTQVVNDTNPLFFYCGTPNHCQKGMFGIINPPNAAGATTSVAGMMQSIAANSSDVMGYAAYTQKATVGNVAAATWGSNIDLASLPEWSHEFVAENVLYTRNLLAANPEVIQDNGSVNLGAMGNNPLMIPQDLAAALSNASPASSTGSTPATTSAAAAEGTTSAASTTSAPANSGALSTSSSKVVVGLVAAFATFMML